MLTNSSTDHANRTELGPAPDGAGATTLAPPTARRPHTTMTACRHIFRAPHHGRAPFRSATHGTMRRDDAIDRFLHLTAKYRNT